MERKLITLTDPINEKVNRGSKEKTNRVLIKKLKVILQVLITLF